MKTFRRLRAAVFLLAACSAQAWAAGPRFVLISHAPDSDPYWQVVKNSAQLAGRDFQADAVDYRNPPTGDLADMARQLEAAVARGYDGIVTSIADQRLEQSPLRQAAAKGIPVITINSGTPAQSRALGALLHIGQPEYDAGKAAGERARAAGVKSYLCVNNFATNPISFERCRGFGDAIGADYKASTIDSGNDPVEIENKVLGYLRRHPQTQAVLALGGSSAEPSIKAVRQLGLAGKVFFATFDMTPEIDAAIKDGTISFAIDQQPFLQGYVPVALLAIMRQPGHPDVHKALDILRRDPRFAAHLKDFGVKPIYTADGINTGPGFVTRDEVGLVERYAGRYR